MLDFEPVDFCREDEVALGQSVDFVSPDGHPHFAPSQVDIRVVALFLGEATDEIGELECSDEILKCKFLVEVVTADDAPFRGDLRLKSPQRSALQRRYAAATRHAMFLGQVNLSGLHGAMMPSPIAVFDENFKTRVHSDCHE